MTEQQNQDMSGRGENSSSGQTLYNIILKLNEATTLRDIIGGITEPAFQAGASEAQLFLFYQDEDERPAYADMAVNWQPAGRVAQIPEGTRLSLADFPLINQWLMKPDDPILISDLAKEDSIDAQAKALLQHNGIVTTIVLPLVLDKKWIGLIFINWETHHQFSQNDVDLYKVLAKQTTIAVNNRLLIDQTNRRAKELATVAEISTTVASQLNQQEMLQTVVDLTKARFGLYHAHIYLLDAEGGYLTLAAGAGEVGKQMVAQGWQIPLDREQSLVARAARSHKGVIINNVQSEPGFLPNELLPDTHSEMAIPLLVGATLLGVLDVQSDIVGRFSFEDVGIQTTLAFQVAVALQNSRQFAQVQQQEKLVRTIIDSTPDWIFIKDTQHRYSLVNQGYANSLHIKAEDFIGKDDLDLGFPEELVKGNPEKGIRGFWSDDNLVMQSDEAKVYPNDPATIDGEVHTFHTYKTPLSDIEGNVTGVLAFSRDISDRIKAEETLRQNEAQLSEALNIALMGNWEYDVLKDEFTFNDQFYKVYKTTAEEQGGYTMSSAEYTRRFLHPEDAGIVGAEIVKALETSDPNFNGLVDHRYIRKDGSQGNMTVRFRIIKDAQGRTVKTYGANQDVTDRILAEKALRDSESLQRTLLENLGIGIIIVDPKTHAIESVNPAVAALFGAPASQLEGMQCHQALCPSEVGSCPITDLGHEVDNADRQFVRVDGTRIPVLKSVKRIRIGDQEKLLESFIDISDRKKAEEALKNSQEKLSEALISSKMGYWDYDVLTDVYTFNDQFYSIFHTTAEEQGGYTMSSGEYSRRFTLAEDGPVVGEAIRQALETTDPNYSTSLDHRFIRADGSQGYLTARFRILKDDQGRTVKFIGANQDITAQKSVELALSEEQGRLSETLKNAKMGYWFYDVPTGIYTFNDQFYSIYHTTAEEQGGYLMSAQDYAQRFTMPEEDGPVVFAEIQKALDTTDPNYSTTIDHRFIRSDGTQGYLTVRIHIIKDSEGHTIKFIGANQDTTEQKLAELALAKRAGQLATVAEVSTTVSTRLDPQDMLQTVVDLTKKRFDLYHAHIYLLDADGESLSLAAGAGEVGKQMVSQGWQIPLDREQSLVARAARTRQGVIINDVRSEPGFMPNELLPETQAEMAVPMLVGDTLVGVLDVQAEIAGRFTDVDVRIMTTLSAQVAVAVQNGRQFAQVQQQEQLVSTLFQASSAVNSAHTYDDILNALRTYTIAGRGAHGVSFSLFDRPWTNDQTPEWINTIAYYNSGLLPAEVISPRYKVKDFPAISTTLNADHITIFEDVENSPVMDENARALYFKVFKTKSALFAPLLVSGQWIGYINILYPELTSFSEQDIRLLTALTGQMGVAVQNLHTTEQIEAALKDLRQNEARLVEALTTAKMGYWEYDVPTGIYSFNDQFYSIYHTTAEEQGGYTMSAQDYSQQFTMPEEDGPVVFSAIQEALETTDPNYSTTIVHRYIRSDGTEGYLTVRFRIVKDSEGHTIKFIGANQDTTEQKLAELALARNARELATVAEVSTTVSTRLDPQEMLQTVVDLTKERFGLYHTHIYLLDANGDSLTLAAGAGEVGKQMVSQGWQIPWDRKQSLVARAVRTRQGVIINDVRSEPGFMPNELLPDTRAEMAVPMLVGDTLLGVLDVQADTVGRFTDEDVRIMTTLSAQVAVAVQNSRQFAQVQQQEKLVRTIIDSTPDWIFIKDTQHRYSLVNQGYANSLHIKAEDFIGKDDLDLGFPEELVKGNPEKGIRGFWSDDNLVMQSDEAKVYPDDPATIDGVVHTFHTYKTPLRDPEGNISGVLAFSRDISDRIKAEETLRQNEAQLSEALNIALMGNWEYDVLKDEFTFNDQFYKVYKTTAEEQGGYTMSSAEYTRRFLHPEDAAVVGGEIVKALETTDPNYYGQVDHRYIRKDGSQGNMTVRFRIIKDDQGRTVKTYGANQDITDRVKMEETVRQDEARLVEALNTAKMGYWEYDVLTDIYTFNDQFYKIYNTTAEEQGGYTMSSGEYSRRFTLAEDGPVVGEAIRQALETTDPNYSTSLDHRFIRADGSQGYLTARFRILKDDQGRTVKFIGANQDITAQKSVELALSEEQGRLSETLKNAKMGYWFYDVPTGIYTFNDQFYSIYHTTAEEQGGYLMSAQDYAQRFTMPEEDGPVVFAEIQKALDTTDPNYSTTIDHRFIRSDGTQGYLTVRIHIIKDSEGHTIKFIGANQDTTEQKLAELALSKEQVRLSEALHNAKMGYWEYDVPTGTYTFNDQFYAIYHTTAEEQGGYIMSAQDYSQRFTMPEEDGPVVFAEIQKALETTDPNYSTTLVHRFIRSDGTEGYLTVRLHILKDSLGNTIKFIGANQDTTEQKLAELALGKRAAQLATVSDVATAVATILSPEILLQKVVDLTKESFGLYHAHIYLLNETGTALVLAAGAGEVGKLMVSQGWQIPLDREQSLVARTARTHKGITVSDVRSEPDFMPNPLLPDTRSEMAVPMIVGDTLLGVLDVQSNQPAYFTEEDVRIETTLAIQVAVALQNARTYAQSQRQAEQEALINEISQKIQTTTSVESAMQVAVRELGRALGAKRTSVQLSLDRKQSGSADVVVGKSQNDN